MSHESYLKLAIHEAVTGIRSGDGGPFGAVVVRDDEVIGTGHNSVLSGHDPTAHAEVNAIRNACSKLGAHHLTGAILYTNFEPCPMCLAAAYWADIRTIYFCAGREVARRIGFMDQQIYKEIALPPDRRQVKSERIMLGEMDLLIDEWDRMEDKILY